MKCLEQQLHGYPLKYFLKIQHYQNSFRLNCFFSCENRETVHRGTDFFGQTNLVCYEQNILFTDLVKLIVSLLASGCCKGVCPLTTLFPNDPVSSIEVLVVVHDTAVLLSAWFKVLCLNRGSWKTPSTQFLSVVTGESCCRSSTFTGEEEAAGEGGTLGGHRSIHEEYSV